MTCTITLNTVREIKEKTEKAAMTLETVALERWVTEGGSIENEVDLAGHNSLLAQEKFRDYAWNQAGSTKKNLQSATLKQYRPSANDISRHNPHV